MSYKYVVNHIPTNTPNKRRPAIRMNPKYITIHNTGNKSSSALNERAWLTNPTNSRQASFHLVVDSVNVVECLPLNEVGYHAGDGRGNGNFASIGIEICESGNYSENLENAIELTAKLLKERGWGVDRLRRHFDWSGKICPRLMYDGGKWNPWLDFKKRVEAKLSSVSTSTSTGSATKPKPTTESNPLLMLNSKGESVKTLQSLLNKNGWKLTVDGIFGKSTLEAVKVYQKNHGLTVDGYVGEATWKRLQSTPTATIQQPEFYGLILNDVWSHTKPDFLESTRKVVVKKGTRHNILSETTDMYKTELGYISKKYMKKMPK